MIQLKMAMDSGEAFSGYNEGPLLFKPTYRYDIHSSKYDTSEKMRIPAWTGLIILLEVVFFSYSVPFLRRQNPL